MKVAMKVVLLVEWRVAMRVALKAAMKVVLTVEWWVEMKAEWRV
jgi:hypothetical protein